MKIGFIDYYLHEWHADNYPQFFADASGGEITVGSAFALIDSPIGGMTTEQWCASKGIRRAASIEQVIEENDCLVVLSPDNPEMHPALCRLPLMSGKRTYIDKTFAFSKKEAEDIFAIAEEYGTPCYSSSALRFANEIKAADKDGIDFISSRGPGEFPIYAIHQVEPIVTLMGSDVKRVMSIGTSAAPGLLIDYADGRRATMNTYLHGDFNMQIKYKAGNVGVIPTCSDYFPNFITDLVDFFRTGEVKVAHDETIAIMGILEKGRLALDDPEHWYAV